MAISTYWTEAPADQVEPIRKIIQNVLDIVEVSNRADMRRIPGMLLNAFRLLAPGAQYQQVSMAVMDLRDVVNMLSLRHTPRTADCVDSAACAAESLLSNMDEILEG